MSLWLFASAFMLVYPAVAFQQTASWEDQRRIVIDLRQQGRLHEAFDGARRYLSAAERHQPGAAPLALALQDYAVIAADLGLYGEADFQDWLHCEVLVHEAESLLTTPSKLRS